MGGLGSGPGLAAGMLFLPRLPWSVGLACFSMWLRFEPCGEFRQRGS